MTDDALFPTSPTLLGRLSRHPNDQEAWGRFVARYHPRILHWCRAWHLQEADAEDVAQNVLSRLARQMQRFHYDPAKSFRGWLRTLTRHALSEFQAARERPGRGSGDSQVLEILKEVKAQDDLVVRLEEEFDRELLEEAMTRVRMHVEPRTWDAFRLTALEGRSGPEAAAQLGMKVTAALKAKNRVQRALREEIARLEQGT
jgi:RNA polymerase sigma-70 factor (ECF subfamily)